MILFNINSLKFNKKKIYISIIVQEFSQNNIFIIKE